MSGAGWSLGVGVALVHYTLHLSCDCEWCFYFFLDPTPRHTRFGSECSVHVSRTTEEKRDCFIIKKCIARQRYEVGVTPFDEMFSLRPIA